MSNTQLENASISIKISTSISTHHLSMTTRYQKLGDTKHEKSQNALLSSIRELTRIALISGVEKSTIDQVVFQGEEKANEIIEKNRE